MVHEFFLINHYIIALIDESQIISCFELMWPSLTHIKLNETNPQMKYF